MPLEVSSDKRGYACYDCCFWSEAETLAGQIHCKRGRGRGRVRRTRPVRGTSLAGSSNLHSNSRKENTYTSGVMICLTWNVPLAAASMRKHGEDSDSS